jgi:hypothetical protein
MRLYSIGDYEMKLGLTNTIESTQSSGCLCRIARLCFAASLSVVTLSLTATCKSIDSADIIFQLRGEDSTCHLGWYMSCLGDINSDGFSDIGLYSNSPVGSKTFVFYGGLTPDTVVDLVLQGGYGPASAIDMDGDAVNEVVTADVVLNELRLEDGFMYFYHGYRDSIGSVPYFVMSPDTGNWAFGWDFRAARVDSDSLADLLVLKYERSPQQLLFYSGAPTIDTSADWICEVPNRKQMFYSDFGFIDFNGDGYLDMYTAQTMGVPGHIDIFLGPAFNSSPDIVINRPPGFESLDSSLFGYGTFNIGDFDGDGWDDLGVEYHLQSLIYRCGPSADTIHDYHLQYQSEWMAPAGDVNGDGYGDLITGGVYYEDGAVQIYLGGPKADTTCDLLITRGMLPPFFLENIGYRVSSAGDFNGDGIDDFMFACENFSGGHRGAVFVVRGSKDIVASVEDRPGLSVPARFELKQNYPNPFNGSTQIQFGLPRMGLAQLTIYNILGNKMNVLVDRELSAGTHSVEWDGKDGNGRVVASGVYLYRLSGEGVSITRKMILLK